jgi:hypothetical protein
MNNSFLFKFSIRNPQSPIILTLPFSYGIYRALTKGRQLSALRKNTYSRILRPSAAGTKLRAAYSRPPQVAIGGLIAGAAAFLSPLIVYLAGSAVANNIHIKGPDFEGRMAWLIDYFGIRVIEGTGIEHSLVNYLVLTAAFSAIGLFSAFIYKMSTVSEGSLTFFERKTRVPYEMIPFFTILVLNPFEKVLEVILGIAVAVLMAVIWKFYYGKVLSVISTVDVSKIIPGIELK